MKIMIVDDEPFYIDHLSEVIANTTYGRAHEVHIVGTCFSAEDAIESIERARPDLVFADIRMQSMSGIELATIIRKEWPMIEVVIVSGYSYFEYARDAIRADVHDYLIKPVDSNIIEELLRKTIGKYRKAAYLRHHNLLSRWLGNELAGGESLDLPGIEIGMGICLMIGIQQGGVRWHDWPLLAAGDEFKERLVERGLLNPREHMWLLSSHEQFTAVAVFMLTACDTDRSAALMNATLHILQDGDDNASAIVSRPFPELQEILPVADRLYDQLAERLLIGESVKLLSDAFDTKLTNPSTVYFPLQDSTEKRRGTLAIEKRDWETLRHILQQWFREWERQRCPSIVLQKNIKKIVNWLEQELGQLDPIISVGADKRLEQIMVSAESFVHAEQEVWGLLEQLFELTEQNVAIETGEQLIEQIRAYLHLHLSEAPSMAEVLDKFQISSTHLGNLFRKYVGKTYVEYLTTLRIEKAQQLMLAHPDMPLKDIAEIVGYIDRHYFTKVFKQTTGLSPSVFRERYK